MAYVYQKYNQSSNATNYQNRQDDATNRYNDFAQTGYTTGAGGFGGQINSAQAKLNQLYGNNNLSQQFKYGNQGAYNKAMNAVANRKAFSYDLSNDTLFRQAKEQYQNMGKVAMADTVGQASAMTGGYGNSYATTAGSQAYQGYLQQLNNDIGNYYSMALSGYNAETDRLNNIYNMYAQDRSQQQNEWSNNWNVYNNLYGLYQSELQNAQSNDLNAWNQKGTNLYNSANLATNQYGTASSNDIDTWKQGETLRAEQAQQEETERANRIEEAYKNAQLAEQIRANKAEEAYRQSALAETIRNNRATEKINSYKAKNSSSSKNKNSGENWYNVNAKATRTGTTSNLISEIDNKARSLQYSKYSGDYTKAINDILPKYLNNAFANHTLSSGEINYLSSYYGASDIGKAYKRAHKTSSSKK